MRFSIATFTSAVIGLSMLSQAVALPEAMSDFESISKRDASTQGSILRRLDDGSRAQVWIDRLDSFRTQLGDLTQIQSDILDKATAALKSGDKSGFADLKQGAIDAFGFDEAKKLLTTLGGNNERRGLSLDARQSGPYCECASVDNWCDGGLMCIKKSKTCTTVPNDCGTFWTDDCDGLCYAS